MPFQLQMISTYLHFTALEKHLEPLLGFGPLLRMVIYMYGHIMVKILADINQLLNNKLVK
jgi:hypothetical protein